MLSGKILSIFFWRNDLSDTVRVNMQILFKISTEIINAKFVIVWLDRIRYIAVFVINVHPGSIIIVDGWIIVLEIKITKTLSLKTSENFWELFLRKKYWIS